MLNYFAFGLSIESEFELAANPHATGHSPDVTIHAGRVANSQGKTSSQEETVNIRHVGKFHISQGREIVVEADLAANMELIRVLLSGRMLGYLLRQRGWLPLHASAIRMGGSAVLFLAAAGAGKSTTAAAFYRHGYSVLSDDISPVRVENGRVLLSPGVARLRLCPDAAEVFRSIEPTPKFVFDKHNFRLRDPHHLHPLPVTRIYVLEDGSPTRVEAFTPLDAVRVVGKECFIMLHRAGHEVLSAHLRDCVAVLERTHVRRLIRPRDLDRLGHLVRVVERDLAAPSSI
ncbi:MAG: hypothetical protein JWN34_4303 [Bryobacterales bacterium]|jgi:hypothetical protein|nr:hypothetical protein [Bryobacterales bacterium]